MERQEFRDRILEAVNAIVPGNRFKQKALKELENLDNVTNTKFIVAQYPDYDHIKISISNGDNFIFDFRFNIKLFEENKEDMLDSIVNGLLPMFNEYDWHFED